jgi:hypothetical protein
LQEANERSGEAHWKTPNTDTTNSSGFTALPDIEWPSIKGTMFMRTLGLCGVPDAAQRAPGSLLFNDSGKWSETVAVR